MSGGSLNYAYEKVNQAAYDIRKREDANARHLEFADHLYRVAKALHDLEWVWSGDKSPGEADRAQTGVGNPRRPARGGRQ